ncbi:hypothetical protein OKA06_17810 [Novosphingobium sp. MW5]|nr:hypothetical protein [Novosphingobium sp. MW5]
MTITGRRTALWLAMTVVLPASAYNYPADQAWAQAAEPQSLYTGTYNCLQGDTPLNLTIIGRARGAVRAQFDFTVPQTGVRGSYLMYGMVGPQGQTALYPDRWLFQPSGYRMVGLSGNLSADGRELSGIVTGTGCRQFVVRLSGQSAILALAPRPTAPPPGRAASPVSSAPASKPAPAAPAAVPQQAARTAHVPSPAPAPTAPGSPASEAITAASMPGVLIRELDDVNQSYNAYAIMGQMLGIPKMAKISDADGSWYLKNMDGSSGFYDFDVRNVQCRFAKGSTTSQSCNYEVSAFVEMVLPIVGTQSGRSPFVKRSDQFTLRGGRWTSQSLRAAMLSGLKPPSGAPASSNPASSLCRALGAGVAATVASKDSVSMYNKAGC